MRNKFIVNTRDLFVKFVSKYRFPEPLEHPRTKEMFNELAWYVGDVLHQNFAEVEHGYFREMVRDSVWETFEPGGWLEVFDVEDICAMVEELFYRISPYVLDMAVGKRNAITGVGCGEFEGLDVVVTLEVTDFSIP